MKHSSLKYVPLVAVWAALFVWGGIAMYQNVTVGNQLTNLTSYVPWGLWVASYIYFIGLSAGAFLLSSLVYGFGIKRLEPIGKFSLYTAIVTLIMALLTIWSDIGKPFRATEIFTRPQFHSMMTWMVWLYSAYFILLVVELIFAFRTSALPGSGARSRGFAASLLGMKENQSPKELSRDKNILRILAIIGIPLAVTFHGGVGALFATVAAQDIWHNPLVPILFLLGALASGGALLTGLAAFFWPRRDVESRDLIKYLGTIVLALLLSYALLEWSEYSIPLWYGVGDVREIQSLNALLFGQYWYVFWIFHVLLGLAVPIILLFFMRERPKVVGFATILAAVMFMAVRLNMVIPAYVEPQLAGLPTAYLGSRLSFTYLPNLFEWQLLAFVVALGVGLLYLGYRFLPLMIRGNEGATSEEIEPNTGAKDGENANVSLARRDFLKWSALMAAGLTGTAYFGGIGTDSSSDYSLTQVSDKEAASLLQTEQTFVYTADSMCAAECGLAVNVVNGVVSSIYGNPYVPYNSATMCAKGSSGKQLVYSPYRIQSPMIRVGDRGEGKFKAVSWDEALAYIAQKLESIKQTYGPESVVFDGGDMPDRQPYWRLFMAYGTPNCLEHGAICDLPRRLGGKLFFGGKRVEPDLMRPALVRQPDGSLKNDFSYQSKLIIYVGWNPFTATRISYESRGTVEAKLNGAKVIVVDPASLTLPQRQTCGFR